MQNISSEQILKQLNWRYATKKFDPSKKISDKNFNTLLESLRLSASSYGMQPWKFIVVKNEELRKKLQPVSWGQTPVVDASHYVVLTYKEKMDENHIDKYLNSIAKTRGVDVNSLAPFREMMIGDVIKGPRSAIASWWAQRQVYIAMGTFLTTAAMLEIDALPMEGLDPVAYDQILGLEGSGFKTVAAIACGYRAEDDAYAGHKKVRFTQDEVIEYK